MQLPSWSWSQLKKEKKHREACAFIKRALICFAVFYALRVTAGVIVSFL